MSVESSEYRHLRMELLDLRNDLSFHQGGIAHGGPEREDWVTQQRGRIREKLGELERCEREGRRYV